MSILPERAPYAAQFEASRGRLHAEPPSAHRNPFARDRDRIVHAAAFRRLKDKTQVFVYHEGDHYRTRLTHSLEVAQIARSIARTLQLDEDLAETLALAHDLGHTPFGHAGERELDHLMAAFGGFDHNAQALRLVTRLEQKYASFDGLNLTWESLEGLVKHNGPLIDADGNGIGHYLDKAIPPTIVEYSEAHDLELSKFGSLEAQVAALADDIAYNVHDVDDGLRAKLFDVIDLGDIPVAGPALADVLRRYPKIERHRLVHETVTRMIGEMVSDALRQTGKNLTRLKPQSLADVHDAGETIVSFSAQMRENTRVLKNFLTRRMYRHGTVMDVMDRARRIMADLFAAYMKNPELLPKEWQQTHLFSEKSHQARQIADFIAGMTDRYAIAQHRKLFSLDQLGD
jgi:dGTPase